MGSREIIADATKATKIAVIALVAIDIIREFREDHFSLASLGVRVLSDVLQAAGAAAIGAAAGVLLTLGGAPVVAVFAVVVVVGFAAGWKFADFDNQHQLTVRARAKMMAYESELKTQIHEFGRLAGQVVAMGRQVAEVREEVKSAWQTIDQFRRLLSGISFR